MDIYFIKCISVAFSEISATAGSADTADYTDIPMNTKVTFAQGSGAEVYKIMLSPDTLVEGIEFFKVVIASVGGMNMADGTVDATLSTANIFILDHSCK